MDVANTLTNFIVADPAMHRAALVEMNVEYMGWVFERTLALHGIAAQDCGRGFAMN